MKILVLNCGSASVKYQLIETSPALAESGEDRCLAAGTIEDVSCYDRALGNALAAVASHHSEIRAVGHRVVHGGDYFSGAAIIDSAVVREIENVSHLAPLHNPLNLSGYRAACAALPGCPHVAVFDTAFHQTIPPHAFLYAIPYGLYRKHRLRRFGFHGTSHSYVAQRYARLQGGSPRDFKLITCHLGNGCSVCAVDRGRSVETSMGFTPLEGLVMGTRAGDLDCGALLHLMEREGLDVAETNRLLNRECGLRGLSGGSHDMRELLARSERGDERAAVAIDVFCYRVKKYIGACFAALNGADALIFTAGIGENAAPVRDRICESLTALGIRLDPQKNLAASRREMEISADGAATRVWVIPTNEELMIARETLAAVLSPVSPQAQG